MSLDTLQSMILAAHAEGDTELASWLGDAADDPQLLAQLTDKGDARESCLESEEADDDFRWLLEHGFTGKDSRGVSWVDGKEVKSTPDAGSGGTGARTSPRAASDDAAVEKKAASLASRIKEVPKALAAKVSSWVQTKYEKLSARYGKTGARAIMAAMVMLAPTPVPGSSLIPIALAEGVLRVRRAVAGTRTEAEEVAGVELSAAEVEAIAKHLLADLEDEHKDTPTEVQEGEDATGHEHKGKGAGGGQFTSKGSGGAGKDNGATKSGGKSDNKSGPAKLTFDKKQTHATPEQHAHVIKKIKAKFAAAPVPTKKEAAAAKRGIKAYGGANPYRKSFVGNSKDRAPVGARSFKPSSATARSVRVRIVAC